MLTDQIYGRDFRSELDLSDKDMIDALKSVIPKSKNMCELVSNYQEELKNSYEAPSQCTVTLLSIIRGIYLTQVKKPVKEEGLLNVDPMTYYQHKRFSALKNDLKTIGQALMKKFSLQDLWEVEITGDEKYLIVA